MNQESKENFKHIQIGKYIKKRVQDLQIPEQRISNFLNITEEEINKTYLSESIDSSQLLRWCKLLNYDFFRFYSQHLILYSPLSNENKVPDSQSTIPQFRKHIYTIELINFILELLETGQKTKLQIIEQYRIPKTTLYKWIKKYSTET